MNFTGINLDLQGVMKRAYENLLYNSSFYKLLNRSYLEDVRQTGTPMIEVIKQLGTGVNKRTSAEITTALTPTLATYESIKVDLTELPLDYSFRISPLMVGSNIAMAIQGQIDLKDSEIAYAIDQYGFNKLNTAIVGPQDGSQAYTHGQCQVWSPTTGDEVIQNLNHFKSLLFDRKINNNYELGLSSNQYAYFISRLTSILKYETRAGVEGVDMGEVANAYGIEVFQINSNVVEYSAVNGSNVATNAVGYFANEVGVVGDTFFSAMNQYPQGMPGYPGYFCLEGNMLFGASVVRPEAVIKLVNSLPAVTAGTFDNGTHNQVYAQTTAFSGTNIATFEASGLPAGLSINATTGAVTGTPTTAGEYNVTIWGVDTYGNFSNGFTGTITIA